MNATNEYHVELQDKILALKKRRNAVILAHYYQRAEIQEIADFIGDSFGLAKQASETQADVILFCGVHFMGESAKILSPEKIVLIPDERAGCPMADMVDAAGLRRLKELHPNAKVVAYVNTSAAVKAETDICCTSSNAVKVIQSVDAEKIIWVPDKNLGHYVSQYTDKQMIIWDGYCNTHDRVLAEDVIKSKQLHPDAPVVVHPECRPEVVKLADYVASTAGIIQYCTESPEQEFIIGTEMGIEYILKRDNPQKTFHFISQKLVCPNMKVNSLKKVLNALETMEPQIHVDKSIADKARISLERMLEVQ